MLKETSEENIMRNLIKKTCFKQLTLRKPELYLFSPVEYQLEHNQYVTFPNRYSRFVGDLTIESISNFIFSLVSSYSEEVRNLSQMNYILAQNQMPTFLYFSEANTSSIIFRGFSSYFKQKIKFAWVPQKMNQVRNSFLKNPNSLPSYHLILQGRVINATDTSDFNSILSFITKYSKINLPNPQAVRYKNTYQFFSTFCKDCVDLKNEIESIREQKINDEQSFKCNTTNEYFWDIAEGQSSLITQKTLNKLLNISENTIYNDSKTDNYLNDIKISSRLIKDSYFNQNQMLDDHNSLSNNIQNEDTILEIKEDKIQLKNLIQNNFTLYKGFEQFDLWEDLKKALQLKYNIFNFKEVDCTSKECTIWARQTFNTLYIPFLVFESQLTNENPILIQNNQEIYQIYYKIQKFIYLPDPHAIKELDSDSAKTLCNEAFKHNYFCMFYLGQRAPLLFKVLSQQKFEKIHFIQIRQPSQDLLDKLGAQLEQIVEVDNKSHISSFIYQVPYQPSLQTYVNQIIKKQQHVQYKYFNLTSLEEIKSSSSKIQIVVQCYDFPSCKKVLNVIKAALKYIHYLNHSSIYYDTEGVFSFKGEQNSSTKLAFIIFNSSRYAPFTVSAYHSSKSLFTQALLVVDQFIQIFDFNQNLVLLE